jgi:O-antigen ligase
MLIAAPVAALRYYRRFHPTISCAGFFLGALMFLPHDASFKIPGLPLLDKEGLIVLALLLASWRWSRERWQTMRIDLSVRILIWVKLIGTAITVLLNRDPLTYGQTTLPAHEYYDIVTMGLADLLIFIIPFLLGHALYRTPNDLRRLLLALAIAGVVYSLPEQYEMVMSPRLQQIFYGYSQNMFGKNRRLWGWRPIMFMQSGIAVGVFMASTAVAAGTLQNLRLRIGRLGTLPVAGYLVIVIIFIKSTAAIIYTLLFTPLARWAGPKLQRWILGIGLFAVLLWPVLRFTGGAPTEMLVNFGYSITDERGGSLGYRFMMEDDAMDRTKERLFFGWGGYARNRVYTESGRIQSIFDAYYINIASQRGIVGLICLFGLLAAPAAKLLRRWKRISSDYNRTLGAGVGFIIVVRLLDMVQNGFYTSLPMLLAGALMGALPGLEQRPKQEPAQA